jgi:outer membrane protein assembly factor BamB
MNETDEQSRVWSTGYIRSPIFLLLALHMVACSGGGGDSGSNSGPGGAGAPVLPTGAGNVSLHVTPPAAISASTLELGPIVDVAGILTNTSSTSVTVYALASSLNVAISSVETHFYGGSDWVARVRFKSPSLLGLGVHRDTLRFRVCYDPQCAGGDVVNSPFDAAIEFSVTGPDPHASLALLDISPRSVMAAEAAFALTLIGTNFTNTSQTLWNGSVRPSTWVSPTRLVMYVLAEDVAMPGAVAVSVREPAASLGATHSATFIVRPRSANATALQINSAHSGRVSFESVMLPASRMWQQSMPGAPSYPLIAEGKVFVVAHTATGSRLVALDRETGAIAWGPVPVRGEVVAAYDAGAVFTLGGESASSSHSLQSFDASSGVQNWEFSRAGLLFRGTPTADHGLVYVLGDIGPVSSLYAINQSSGELAWARPLTTNGALAVAVGPEGVYASFVCDTYAFLPTNGYDVWRRSRGCRSSGGGGVPVLVGSTLYAPDVAAAGEGTLLDSQTGTVFGTYSTNRPPVVGADTAYIFPNGNRNLDAVSRGDGTLQWSFNGDQWGLTLPVLVNDTLFVASERGVVYGLNAATGEVVWQKDVGEQIHLSTNVRGAVIPTGLAAGDGLLVVPGMTTVTAYRLTSAP